MDGDWLTYTDKDGNWAAKFITLFCRGQGVGGSTVDLVASEEGLKTYFSDECVDRSPGNTVSWEELEQMLQWAKERGLHKPK